jgi:hypothetical protein
VPRNPRRGFFGSKIPIQIIHTTSPTLGVIGAIKIPELTLPQLLPKGALWNAKKISSCPT